MKDRRRSPWICGEKKYSIDNTIIAPFKMIFTYPYSIKFCIRFHSYHRLFFFFFLNTSPLKHCIGYYNWKPKWLIYSIFLQNHGEKKTFSATILLKQASSLSRCLANLELEQISSQPQASVCLTSLILASPRLHST